MISKGVKMQLLAFLAITLIGVSYVSARYVGLGDVILGDGYVVTADFEQSGGIFENAEVTYRGVAVGRVDRMRLAEDGVHVDLRLDEGTKVPANTRAVVENRSAVGEQYVDLQPRSKSGPFLAEGSRIRSDVTASPLPTETLLVNLDRLVNSVDRDDLVTVIDELGAAFAGSGRDLQRLIDSGDALTAEAIKALPETTKLIDDGAPVLATQRESGSAIKSFSADLADLSQTLVDSDADLRKVLDNGVVSARELEALFRDNRTSIRALFANLITTGQVTLARIEGLEQILVTYPANVAGGYTVVTDDEKPGTYTSHFGLVLNASDPPPCTRGYEGTNTRTPNSYPRDRAADKRTPANTNARCNPPDSRTTVRGAQNAPRPGSGSARSVPGADAAAGPAGHTADAATPYVTGFDAASGLAMGPGGTPLKLGSRGGQAEAFGEDSWEWLLLGPLGS